MTVNPQFLPVEAKPLSLERQKLLEAAEYIRQHGWCQHTVHNAQGQVCLVGALWTVSELSDGSLDVNTVVRCSDLFKEHLQCRGPVHDWNDIPGRTKEEVISALEGAALS